MRSFLAVLSVVSILAIPSATHPCCGVGKIGVKFAGQTNLIVWDAKRGIEHFVRDARFTSKDRSIGFIAPTPSRPDVQPASGRAFKLLRDLTLSKSLPPAAGGMPTDRSVHVIEVKEVSGYQATVLRATDATALSTWLKANGYPMTKGVQGWLKPYVQRGWYLTAFKVSLRNHTGATGPVRLSFRTERPFSPYSVPRENTGRSPLEIFYVSATLDEPRVGGTTKWLPAAFIIKAPGSVRAPLAKALGLAVSDIPENAFVQQFRDESFSRPGFDDLYFIARDQRTSEAKFQKLSHVGEPNSK